MRSLDYVQAFLFLIKYYIQSSNRWSNNKKLRLKNLLSCNFRFEFCDC
jgi:hypothetical protein